MFYWLFTAPAGAVVLVISVSVIFIFFFENIFRAVEKKKGIKKMDIEEIKRNLKNRKITPEQKKALLGSIEKWNRILAGTGLDEGARNCELCLQNDHCKRCVVWWVSKGCEAIGHTAWQTAILSSKRGVIDTFLLLDNFETQGDFDRAYKAAKKVRDNLQTIYDLILEAENEH